MCTYKLTAKITGVITLILLFLWAPPPASAVIYTYDPLGRISSATYNSGVKVNYTFDEGGSLLSITKESVPDIWPPKITRIDPAESAVSVPVNKNITATLSEMVQPGDNFNGITLKAGDTEIAVNCRIELVGSNEMLIIDPVENLPSGTICTVTVPADAIKDVNDNFLGKTYTFAFTTKTAIPTESRYTGDLSGQFSDSVNFKARLTNKEGLGLEEKPVTLTVGQATYGTVTGPEGYVAVVMALDQAPGDYPLKLEFAGDEDYMASSVTSTFSILKESVAVAVYQQEGFPFEILSIKAQISDDDKNMLPGGLYRLNFTIGEQQAGQALIDEYGQATVQCSVYNVPASTTETLAIRAYFAGNDYYQEAGGQNTFTLKSAKWLKEDALHGLESLLTENKKSANEITKAIEHLGNSLDKSLWLDASHLEVKQGHKVFDEEKKAVENLLKIIKEKVKDADTSFVADIQSITGEIVKADEILGQVLIKQAESIVVNNPKEQEKVNREIEKAKEEIAKAAESIKQNEAVDHYCKAWLHAQNTFKVAEK